MDGLKVILLNIFSSRFHCNKAMKGLPTFRTNTIFKLFLCHHAKILHQMPSISCLKGDFFFLIVYCPIDADISPREKNAKKWSWSSHMKLWVLMNSKTNCLQASKTKPCGERCLRAGTAGCRTEKGEGPGAGACMRCSEEPG